MKKTLSGTGMKVLSIDIGGTNVKYGSFIVKDEVEMIESGFFKTPDSFDDLYKYFDSFLREKKYDAVTIGVPGVYDFVGDMVVYAPNLKLLNNLKIKESFSSLFDNAEILVENDGNMAAFGEYFFIVGSKLKTFIMITLGTGVGGGVIYNGGILSGRTTISELGHITINFNGRRCGCGKLGCFEAYCGMDGLIQTYNEVSGGSIKKVDDIFKKSQKKDVLARISIDIFSYQLATGLSSLANIFSPECIKIGGGLSFYSDLFYKKTVKHFSKMIFPAFKQYVKLDIATLKNNAGIYGGVALAISNLLSENKRSYKLNLKK